MLKLCQNRIISIVISILLVSGSLLIAPIASSADETGVVLAAFNNSAYAGISNVPAYISLTDEHTYNGAPTSLEWNLDANYFNVNIGGKGLDAFENGGNLCVRFKGSEGTNFNIVYQKKPNANAQVGNYKSKVTSDGTWQIFKIDFSLVSKIYDDTSFAVKFDCGGWSIKEGKDYIKNDKIYIDSVWFDSVNADGGSDDSGEDIPDDDFNERENEPGLMYLADFNKPDANSYVVAGTGSVSKDVTYDRGTYSLKWVLDKYMDIDLPSNTDWTEYDNVNIRLCAGDDNQSVNVVFIAPEAYIGGQIYRTLATIGSEWTNITIPISNLEKIFQYSSNGKSMGVLRFDASGWSNTAYTKGTPVYIDSVYLTCNEYNTALDIPVSNIDGYDVVCPDIEGNNSLKFNFGTELYDIISQNSITVMKDGENFEPFGYLATVDLHSLNITFNERLSPGSTYKVILSAGSVRSQRGAVLKEDITREFTVGYNYGYALFDAQYLLTDKPLTVCGELLEGTEAVVAFYNQDSSVIKTEKIDSENGRIFEKTYTVPSDAYYAKVYMTDDAGRLVYVTRLDANGKKNWFFRDGESDIKDFEAEFSSYVNLEIKAEIYAKNSPVLIRIYGTDGKICHEDALVSSDNSKIEYDYTYTENHKSGKYTVLIKFGETEKSQDVFFISQSDSSELLLLANEGNHRKISDWLNMNSAIVAHLFDNEDKIDDAAKIISENCPYASYDELNDIMEKIPDSLGELNSRIWSDMAEYIHAHSEFLPGESEEYPYFKKLTPSKQNDICESLVGYKPFNTVAEFRTAFENEVNDYRKKNGKSSSVGSGGGGGKSSSRITAVTTVTQESVQPDITAPMPEAPFKDLSGYEWAHGSIKELYLRGVISDSADNCFRPGDKITREEFVKLIIQALFKDSDYSVHCFTDEKDGEWYNEYISRAYSLGIVTGRENGSFGIGENITREDMVTVICRALEKYGFSPDYSAECEFLDSDEISDYAMPAVCAMAKMGVVNGIGNGIFAPGECANRAQAAKIIHSVMNLCVGGK